MEEFDLNYRHFLDRSTIIYGESGTGKSYLIVDVLHALKPHIEQIIVVSPTDRQNHTYDRGIVPLPFIHYTITPKLLEDIWERQTALSAIYSKTHGNGLVQALFNKIPNNEQYKQRIQLLKEALDRYESTENDKKKIEESKEAYNSLVALIQKKQINLNYKRLSNLALTSDEQMTLKYINLNPKLVLIFDDCTDLINKFKSHPVMQKLFYQGRHANITFIFACHTDKVLSPELKKNSFVNMFTSEKSARSYLERKSNDLNKEEKNILDNACKRAFTPAAPHQKLVMCREGNRMYKYTAKLNKDFRFGSDVLWNFSKEIQADANSLNTNNHMLQMFLNT